jgi:NADP-dependent 3-hydroxy acid dehydrogenase YdfG
MQKVWFVTGSSPSFGREIAEAALKRGDRVDATARKPDQLDDVAKAYGEHVLTYALDVTDSATARRPVARKRTESQKPDTDRHSTENRRTS